MQPQTAVQMVLVTDVTDHWAVSQKILPLPGPLLAQWQRICPALHEGGSEYWHMAQALHMCKISKIDQPVQPVHVAYCWLCCLLKPKSSAHFKMHNCRTADNISALLAQRSRM